MYSFLLSVWNFGCSWSLVGKSTRKLEVQSLNTGHWPWVRSKNFLDRTSEAGAVKIKYDKEWKVSFRFGDRVVDDLQPELANLFCQEPDSMLGYWSLRWLFNHSAIVVHNNHRQYIRQRSWLYSSTFYYKNTLWGHLALGHSLPTQHLPQNGNLAFLQYFPCATLIVNIFSPEVYVSTVDKEL